MAASQLDPQVAAHLEWLGFVQPTGLVVSAPALVRAGAILDKRDAEGQRLLRESTQQREFDRKVGPEPWLPDFEAFVRSVLGWSFSAKGYAGTADSPIPADLEVVLHEFDETLRPDYAVRELEAGASKPPWQLLVKTLSPGQDFDRVATENGKLEASPHGRIERLLRRTGVAAGLLFNGRALRLVAAPHGESSGWMDFRVADMVRTDGRAISTALRLLLSQTRLLALPRRQRLTALLEDSRQFQNEVSDRLAEQVLHALYELLRGFQAAHDATKGELLRQPLAENPDEVYRALLTVILRLVFLLYAEERDMLPEDETFLRHYSLAGLYERLREDAALYPDTMEQRHGAWAHLLVLFRLVFDGAEVGDLKLPKRHGILFDPDRFPFLEGRPLAGARQIHERIESPLVPDGTIYRVLEKLLVLDGERISYRALDVEQIGSVYETMMGFRVERATGLSIAIRASERHGAPTAIDLEALLAEAPTKRERWLEDHADRKLTDKVGQAMKDAATVEDLHSALQSVIDLAASPDLVPQGAMVLQPSEERRHSGSHYTPRSLTEPIVRTTLEPVLSRLSGPNNTAPSPSQILDLKVCDPAMGSGAFLVEACRQLGDALVAAWHVHGGLPTIPPDEDETIFARRLVARRCLYGVDRNPVAVDLAKLSLWLVTLAKDHALTFVDHALRHGDSLVGLSRRQIEAFHWDGEASAFQAGLETLAVREHFARAAGLRQRIREAGENISDWQLRDLWDETQQELSKLRFLGDLVVSAWFDGENASAREAKRREYAAGLLRGEIDNHGSWLEEQRQAELPLVPFHWEIEFPEVFERLPGGFDATTGNPPFSGAKSLARSNRSNYTEWLRQQSSGTGGKCDLVAFFFRRSYEHLATGGTLGLIGTKTVAQGDTRRSGLLPMIKSGAVIYSARRHLVWPGRAAVIVSVIHAIRGSYTGAPTLDGRPVGRISAFLLNSGVDDDPVVLSESLGLGFLGSKTLGIGFVIDDNNTRCPSSGEVEAALKEQPAAASFIRPYVGGEDLMTMPVPGYPLQVIDCGELKSADLERWPSLVELLRKYVWPDRKTKTGSLRDKWWMFAHRAKDLYEALAGTERFIATAQYSNSYGFCFLQTGGVVNSKIVAFPLTSFASFCSLQSRVHEVWARAFSSTLKDDLQYTPTDCLATFPFPKNWQTDPSLEAAGDVYYQFRAALMAQNDQGLTKIYNRFHEPEEQDQEIVKLRELHTSMDRAVLNAYGWRDIPTDCEFILDYEIDEEEWGAKKKPSRFRWPDEVRDKVLARLLELNAERAKDEQRSGAASEANRGRRATARRRAKAKQTEGLF